ncbi:MAG: hypothetical protein IIZ43_03510 [Eubacterium sp.]|nr:hypothetical protein [Eubacterium sp.]
MKIGKKAIIFILITAMVIGMSACGSTKPEAASETASDASEGSAEAVSGGWVINDQELQAKLPEEVEKAFSKATETLTGATLEPVAYVGSQVVAGMNYMILCRATSATEKAEATYQMAVIYADLEGNAEITSLKDFVLSRYTEGEGTRDVQQLTGGWSAAADAAGAGLPENAKDAYDKALETVCWEWAEVEPLACLGSQVVSGTNYAILCKGTLTEDGSAERIFVVTIYEDLKGNAEVTNINILDLAEFNE